MAGWSVSGLVVGGVAPHAGVGHESCPSTRVGAGPGVCGLGRVSHFFFCRQLSLNARASNQGLWWFAQQPTCGLMHTLGCADVGAHENYCAFGCCETVLL